MLRSAGVGARRPALAVIPSAACAIVLLRAPSAAAAAPGPPPPCAGLRRPRHLSLLDARLQDRYAILDGRSFYGEDCVVDHPRLTAVLRISSADYPRPPLLPDGASDILTVAYQLRGASLATISVDDVAAAARRAGVDVDPAAAQLVFHYLYAADRDAVLARARRELSTAEVVAAVQYIGYLALLRYDAAKGAGTLHRTALSTNQVADAAAAALAGDHPELSAGACADIANAQADLLRKLGAKDAVVATTAHLIGLHSTVLARTPGRQTYHHFNYDNVSEISRREGPALLRVPGDDPFWTEVGVGVYLNEPSGPTVGYVPTDAGKVYAEAAGMNFHELEPLARADSSLLGARVGFAWHQSLQAFVARDASGALESGLGLTQAWAPTTSFPGVAGLVIATRHIRHGVTVLDFYLQIEQRARTPSLRIGRWVRAQLDGTLVLVGSYALPLHDLAGNLLGADAALALDTGVQADIGTPGGVFTGRARVDVQLMPGLRNVGGATPTVFVNRVGLAFDGRVRLGLTPLGPAALVASHAILFDAFGPRLALGVGLEAPRLGVRLQAIGRALDDTPTYKEGSLRRLRLAAAYDIHHALQASAAFEVQEARTDPWWTVTGALGTRF